MKKLYLLFLTLFTSVILFFSCDPHAKDNSICITIDSETINKLTGINSQRSPVESTNPLDAHSFYAYLIGDSGTKYEKTVYVNSIDGHSSIAAEIYFPKIPVRENYDLYVYYVDGGTSRASAKKENIQFNLSGPTRLSVNLSGYEQTPFDHQEISLDQVHNSTDNGNFTIRIEYEPDYKVNDKAITTFKLRKIYDNYKYDFYVLNNGKQTNITSVREVEDTDDQATYYYFDYTFNEEGVYYVSCRITNPETNLFITKFLPVELKSNIINTGYMIYSNGSAFKAGTSSTFSDTIPDSYTNYSTNPTFDFCFDGDMNYYTTNGISVFKNTDYTNAYINPNTYDIATKKINYDFDSGIFTIYGSKEDGTTGFGVHSGYYNLNNWYAAPGSYWNCKNAIFHNGKMYLFYHNSDYIDHITLTIEEYTLSEGKPGVLSLSSDHETYRVFTMPYDSGESSTPSFDVEDIIILNNQLYFLANVHFPYPIVYNLNSFGFVGKLNLSDKSIEITGIDPSIVTNNTETDNSYKNKNYYSTNRYSIYLAKSEESKPYFSLPRNFIAIKPKKLIVADDGYVFWTDDTTDKYRNSNRVITVDLESFSITDVTKLNNIKWLREESVTWESSGAYIYFGE